MTLSFIPSERSERRESSRITKDARRTFGPGYDRGFDIQLRLICFLNGSRVCLNLSAPANVLELVDKLVSEASGLTL